MKGEKRDLGFEGYCATACGQKGGTGSTKGGWLRRQTVRLQTGSAPWNAYSTYDRNLVRGDFGAPLRFARNDGEREVSAVRYP